MKHDSSVDLDASRPWSRFLVVCSLLFGSVCAQVANASDDSSAGRNDALRCKVDSRFYSAPYKLGDGKFADVPIRDGSLITINWSRPGRMKVLIQDEPRFSSCDESVFTIEKLAQAKNLLSETRIADAGFLVDASLGICRTADERWFFIFKKDVGYIGNSGPAPVPLSLVGMKCE